jgi:EpsI family protein
MNDNLRFGATILVLGATVGVAKFNSVRTYESLSAPLSSIGREIGGWVGTDDAPPSERVQQSLAATSFLSRTYRRGTLEMSLWIAYYANQRAGESMHSPKYCLPGAGWELMEQEAANLATREGGVRVNEYVLMRPGDRLRMLYWYQNRNRVVASEYVGKLALVWDAMRSGQRSGSIVRITLPDDPAGRAEAAMFAAAIMEEVNRCFGD